uniref:Uncharacterized protein n=1 Tax=Anguilla anguilla TaxID=7936 RepID=A0A0E9T4Z8_ANGAN
MYHALIEKKLEKYSSRALHKFLYVL